MHVEAARVPWARIGAIIASIAVAQIVQDGALAPLLAAALDARDVPAGASGVIVSVPYLAVALLAPFAAWLFNRAGAAICVAAGAAISGIALLAYAVWTHPVAWGLLGVPMGFAMALRWVCGEAWLLSTTPGHHQGRVVGLMETAIGISYALGPLILVVTGTGGMFPFAVCAAVMAVAAITPFLAGSQRKDVPSEHEAAAPDSAAGGWRTSAMLRLCALSFAGGSVETGMHTFVPIVIRTEDLLGGSAMWAAVLFGVGGAVSQIPIGAYSDRVGPWRVASIVVPATLVGGAVLAFAPFGGHAPAVVFLLGASSTAFYTVALLRVQSDRGEMSLAAAMARLSIAGTAGSVAGPVVYGFAIDLLGAAGMGVATVGLTLLVFLARGR